MEPVYGGTMDLPDGLADEVDEELFQLIPLGPDNRGEMINHNLYHDDGPLTTFS
jgi:hypothetical protein